MPLIGDFGKLFDLTERLGDLAGPGFKVQANELLAQASLSELAQEFEQGRDPYGQSWLPPKHRIGQPLRDTGRLANSFGSESSASGFSIGTDVIYAGVHQYGATIRRGGKRRGKGGRFLAAAQFVIPQRQMIPEGDLGLIWTMAFESELSFAVLNLMGGG